MTINVRRDYIVLSLAIGEILLLNFLFAYASVGLIAYLFYTIKDFGKYMAEVKKLHEELPLTNSQFSFALFLSLVISLPVYIAGWPYLMLTYDGKVK